MGTMYSYYSICFIVFIFYFHFVRCNVCVNIDSGCVCGSVREAEEGVMYESFRGIPYAQPPLGNLRFAAPQSVTPWTTCLRTREDGAICPQYDEEHGRLVNPQKGMSEDCLFVNVHVPLKATTRTRQTTATGLPIFMFVHGGGFQCGSGNSDMYGPEYMMRKNFIVITFNYRINVFGFLSRGTSKIPGNAGLRDILKALEWVKTNAVAFGGNPNDITLAGQGAGAALVHLLTLSPRAQGLFNRAILMSGTAIPAFYTPSRVYADQIATLTVQLLGITSMNSSVIDDELINMPLTKLMAANRIIQNITGFVSYVPVIESDRRTAMLDDDPINLIKAGRGRNISLIVGFAKNEAVVFKHRLTYMNTLYRFSKHPLLLLSPRIYNMPTKTSKSDLATRVISRYFQGFLTIDKYIQLCSDTFFVYPAFKLVQWRAALHATTYLYRFSFDSTFNVMKESLKLNYEGGGGHVEDLTHIFRTNSIQGDRKVFPPINRDDLMKYWMIEYVANFVNCSKPFCDDSSAWPAADGSRLNYQDLYDPIHLNSNTPAPEDYRNMVQFWDDIEMTAKNVTSF